MIFQLNISSIFYNKGSIKYEIFIEALLYNDKCFVIIVNLNYYCVLNGAKGRFLRNK